MSDFAQEKLQRSLIATIESHLPSASHLYPEGLEFSKRSELYAESLAYAFKAPLLQFGLGASEADWKRVRRAATELEMALKALGNDGLREVNRLAPLWWDDERPLGYEVYLIAKLLSETAINMEKKRKASPKPSNKRNWKAAALAKVARRIWGEEEWRSKPEKYGHEVLNALVILALPPAEAAVALAQRGKFESHLENFAPRTEKHSGLGPFGKFLRDLLKCFGCEISPASALRSLGDIQKVPLKVHRTTSKN